MKTDRYSDTDIAKEKLQAVFDRFCKGLIRVKTVSPLAAPVGEVNRVLVVAETTCGDSVSYMLTVTERGDVSHCYRLEKVW
jgi:hypothetical protein